MGRVFQERKRKAHLHFLLLLLLFFNNKLKKHSIFLFLFLRWKIKTALLGAPPAHCSLLVLLLMNRFHVALKQILQFIFDDDDYDNGDDMMATFLSSCYTFIWETSGAARDETTTKRKSRRRAFTAHLQDRHLLPPRVFSSSSYPHPRLFRCTTAVRAFLFHLTVLYHQNMQLLIACH